MSGLDSLVDLLIARGLEQLEGAEGEDMEVEFGISEGGVDGTGM